MDLASPSIECHLQVPSNFTAQILQGPTNVASNPFEVPLFAGRASKVAFSCKYVHVPSLSLLSFLHAFVNMAMADTDIHMSAYGGHGHMLMGLSWSLMLVTTILLSLRVWMRLKMAKGGALHTLMWAWAGWVNPRKAIPDTSQ